jgi:hypothetical protein
MRPRYTKKKFPVCGPSKTSHQVKSGTSCIKDNFQTEKQNEASEERARIISDISTATVDA